MSYNNQGIKKDVNGQPIPQYWNEITRQFEVLKGDATITLYGLSTETKTTTDMVKGNVFFEIDTSSAYMFDGTKWVEI